MKESVGRQEEILVTTVFDLMAAHLGMDRGHGGDCAQDYDDPALTLLPGRKPSPGFPEEDAIRVAREFAENAEKTGGKSMIFLGAGTNHWYHSDTIYRAIISLTTLCGCQGVNGGGWAHYVGQEKVRPLAGWSTLAFGLDWMRPPRCRTELPSTTSQPTTGAMKHLAAAHIALRPWAGEIRPGHRGLQHPRRTAGLASLPTRSSTTIRLNLRRSGQGGGAATEAEIISHVAESSKRAT